MSAFSHIYPHPAAVRVGPIHSSRDARRVFSERSGHPCSSEDISSTRAISSRASESPVCMLCVCVCARVSTPLPSPATKTCVSHNLSLPHSLLPSLSPSPTANNLCPNHHQHAPDSRASSPCCFTACTIIGTACSGEGAASGVACIGFRV